MSKSAFFLLAYFYVLLLHSSTQGVRGGDFDCSFKSVTNPEKGSYGSCDLTHSSNDYSNTGIEVITDSFGDVYQHEYTLCYGQIALSSFLTSPIDDRSLSLIKQHFAELKVAGVKAIVRIVYATDMGEPDTSLDWVETHLQQLQPIFVEHKDIIAWFQGGIIGAWGEWHNSSSGLDSVENKVEVYNLLHTYLPSSPCMKVQVRYPMIMPSLTAVVANEEEAFNDHTCTKAQRLGFHNDCWMSNWHDTGTYEHGGAYDGAAREHWLGYLENVTKFSPYGGETCVDSDSGGEVWDQFNCSFMFAEAAVLHATFLNPKWHPAVTRRMQEECCWEEFTDRSGYRFELKTVNLTSPSGATATTESSGSSLALTVPLGGTLNYSLAVENTGWSSLFSQRRAYLILTQTVRKGDMVSVAVDGEVEEWPQVRSGWEDEQSAYTAAVADVRSVRVANDEDHLYIFVSFYNVTDGMAPFANGYFRIFFDTDNSSSTGYEVSGMGSEFLLEGSNCYDQRSGAYSDGAVAVGVMTAVSEDGLGVEISLDRRARYGDNSSVFPAWGCNLIVNIADTSWNLVEFSPKVLGGYQYSFSRTSDMVVRYDHDIGSDLRQWRPERGVVTVTGAVVIPADLFAVSWKPNNSSSSDSDSDSAGSVSVGLWFPDSAGRLRNHSRMSIQLGSTIAGGSWSSEMGANMLPHVLNITSPATESGVACFTIATSYQ